MRRDNVGVFLRGTYWYDTAQRDHNQRAVDIDDRNRQVSAKTAGAELLDAFAYALYDIDGEPGSLRLGKQVVNWGESLFIQGGLNVVNPFNQAALRRPGSEVKDALTPVEAMPHWLQPITLVNPIRHFGIITHSCLMKGSGLDTLWPNYLALMGFATVLLTLSVRRFRKQLG